MKLTRSHGGDIYEPSDRQIDEALEDIEDEVGSFVILEREGGFLQTTGRLPNQLIVEYREGERQYQSTNRLHSIDAVKEMFKRYRREDAGWMQDHQWKELDFGTRRTGCAGNVLSAVLIAGLVGILAT